MCREGRKYSNIDKYTVNHSIVLKIRGGYPGADTGFRKGWVGGLGGGAFEGPSKGGEK